MQIRFSLLLCATIILLGSCTTSRQISYFQDLQPEVAETIIQSPGILVKPEDKIAIIVNSKDPLLANLFNLPVIAYRVGQVTPIANNNSQQVSSYTVDTQGSIDFPVIGKLTVSGLNREQIATLVKQELITRNLVKDPVVTVEFTNHAFAILGEVNRPGRYGIDRDKLTILDALGMAGDLTIYGQRNKILLLRQQDGKQVAYRLDLNSARKLLESPAYYLQQNDVIYVEPNSVRARQSTINGNNVRSSSFWFSLASLLTTVVVLIIK